MERGQYSHPTSCYYSKPTRARTRYRHRHNNNQHVVSYPLSAGPGQTQKRNREWKGNSLFCENYCVNPLVTRWHKIALNQKLYFIQIKTTMRKDGSSVVFVVVVVVADPSLPCGHKSHIVKYWITQDMGRHGLSLAGKSGKKGSFFFHIFNLVGQKDAHAYVPTHTCSPLPWPHPLVTFCLRLFCCAYLIKIWSYDYFVRGVDWFEVEGGGERLEQFMCR